jgi:hypothetical protein
MNREKGMWIDGQCKIIRIIIVTVLYIIDIHNSSVKCVPCQHVQSIIRLQYITVCFNILTILIFSKMKQVRYYWQLNGNHSHRKLTGPF